MRKVFYLSGMARIAHIVNPFLAPKGSEWEWVQAITWASIQKAHSVALEKGLAVELLSAQFESDLAAVPEGFRPTPSLKRSVRDLPGFSQKPALPFIADILHAALEASEAEFFIFTNSDIALQPHFYLKVQKWIDSGLDAFIINRRRIPGHYRSVDQLPEMYAEQGKPHPGFDCFVLHRDLIPQFQLADICTGIPFIEITLGQNCFALARNFKLFDLEFLTFHIGEEVFKKRDPDLLAHNRREFKKAIAQLWPKLNSKKWPYYHWVMPVRLIRWGLHPCLPIVLALKLEWKRLLGK